MRLNGRLHIILENTPSPSKERSRISIRVKVLTNVERKHLEANQVIRVTLECVTYVDN